MAGKKGVGGFNKIPVEIHALRGTLRKTRHLRPPTLTLPAVPRVEPLPAGLLDGLHGRGAVFCRDVFFRYDGWHPANLQVLKETARTLDALEELHAAKDRRGVRATQKILVDLLRMLNLQE